jgi:hypothetical protein
MTATDNRDTLDLGNRVSSPTSAPAGVNTPLFHVEGATEGTTQWKAATFQLINWGGFEGRVQFDFDPGATLISGASGTGKSTLLDAYIALMMPSDTPFNGASNDAIGGRARSAEQRNLLSYLRGQTDTTADDAGRSRPKVLRGDGRATWGSVGITFIDDRGGGSPRCGCTSCRSRPAAPATLRCGWRRSTVSSTSPGLSRPRRSCSHPSC